MLVRQYSHDFTHSVNPGLNSLFWPQYKKLDAHEYLLYCSVLCFFRSYIWRLIWATLLFLWVRSWCIGNAAPQNPSWVENPGEKSGLFHTTQTAGRGHPITEVAIANRYLLVAAHDPLSGSFPILPQMEARGFITSLNSASLKCCSELLTGFLSLATLFYPGGRRRRRRKWGWSEQGSPSSRHATGETDCWAATGVRPGGRRGHGGEQSEEERRDGGGEWERLTPEDL